MTWKPTTVLPGAGVLNSFCANAGQADAISVAASAIASFRFRIGKSLGGIRDVVLEYAGALAPIGPLLERCQHKPRISFGQRAVWKHDQVPAELLDAADREC